MGDIRKQIIELIEPYMNKELSEGCMIILKGRLEHIIPSPKGKNDSYSVYYGDEIEINRIPRINVLVMESFNDGYGNKKVTKILGHYDITAVLKYIDKEHREKDVCYPAGEEPNGFWSMCADLFEYTDITGKIRKCSCGEYNISSNITYGIPNKPLHLYTEQEEKDLLKFLKELG